MYVRTYSNLNTLPVERLSQSLPLLSYPSSSFIFICGLADGYRSRHGIRVLSACESDTGTQNLSIKYRTTSTGFESSDPTSARYSRARWELGQQQKQNDQSLCFS